MSQLNFRTYQRRNVTRESGYHTCKETTGSECIVIHANRCNINQNEIFTFKKNNLHLKKTFGKNSSILAFGGYIYCQKSINITYDLSYIKNKKTFNYTINQTTPLNANDWNNIGFHKLIEIENYPLLENIIIKMKITTPDNNYIDLIGFDINIIDKSEFEKKTRKQFAEYIWNKFDHKCFKCKKELTLNEMNLDHTMPLAYLYRLDDTATCLCSTHNSQKSDTFPVDYYSKDELIELSKITGLPLKKLQSKEINKEVLNLLVKNVVWFYDDFLMHPEYQKKRDGILTANKINDSLKRVIANKVDLAEEYKKRTGHYPSSITIIEK